MNLPDNLHDEKCSTIARGVKDSLKTGALGVIIAKRGFLKLFTGQKIVQYENIVTTKIVKAGVTERGLFQLVFIEDGIAHQEIDISFDREQQANFEKIRDFLNYSRTNGED